MVRFQREFQVEAAAGDDHTREKWMKRAHSAGVRAREKGE